MFTLIVGSIVRPRYNAARLRKGLPVPSAPKYWGTVLALEVGAYMALSALAALPVS